IRGVAYQASANEPVSIYDTPIRSSRSLTMRSTSSSPIMAPHSRSGCSHGALLDALFRIRIDHDAVDVDARQVHLVRVDLADLHQLLDLGHANPSRHGTGRIEVARSLAEHQIAGPV